MVKLRGHEEYRIYFGAKPEILRLAGDLRHSMTNSEKLLWNELRNRKINEFRFRRQHPVSEVIVDFFCYEAMLAIEIDGSVHEDSFQKERDIERTKVLNRLAIEVIRFSNDEVEKNISSVNKLVLTPEQALDSFPEQAPGNMTLGSRFALLPGSIRL